MYRYRKLNSRRRLSSLYIRDSIFHFRNKTDREHQINPIEITNKYQMIGIVTRNHQSVIWIRWIIREFLRHQNCQENRDVDISVGHNNTDILDNTEYATEYLNVMSEYGYISFMNTN